MLELEEPYRQTVLLRYYEGLSSPEIARRLEVPAGTVRWRLSNALGLLRERLDREYGNRAAWSLLLAPLAGREASLVASTSAGASATLQGILAVHTGWKVAIAALVVLSVIAFTPLGRMVALLSSEAETSELPEAEAVASAEASGQSSPDSADEARVPAEPERAGAAIAEVATVPTFTGVVLRVLDPEGRPLADVTVELHSTRALAGQPVDSARTDAGGRATVELIGEIDAEGRPVSGAPVDVDRLVSEYGPGRLEEERIMRTVQGVRPGLAGVASDGEKRTTDEQGFFQLDRVATGAHSLWSWAEGHLAGCVRPVEVRDGVVTGGIVVELGVRDPTDFIQGVVLDPNGRPEAAARVEMKYAKGNEPRLRRSYWTDLRGRFALPWLPAVPLTLVVSDRASKWTPIVHAGVEGGAEDLVLRFNKARPQELVLTLVGPDGPARDAVIFVYDEHHDEQLLLPQDVESRDEVYRFRVPVEPYVVDIWCEGHDFERVGPFDGLAGPREVTVELRSLPGVRGRVLANGAPVPGARVTLSETASQQTWNCGFPVRVAASPAAGTTGDGSGEFALTLLRSGTFILRAEADDFAPAELGPLFIDKERGAQGLEIELTGGGAIEGRVLPLPGGSPAGVIVAISRGDARATSQRVGADGRFRFEKLLPGSWLIARYDAEVYPGNQMSMIEAVPFDEAEIRTNCTVVEGGTTRFDLDLAGNAAEMVLEGCLIIENARLPGDDGRPVDHYFGTAEGVDVEIALFPGADGAARLTGVPAGQGQIVRITHEQSDGSEEPLPNVVELVDVSIVAGKATTVRLP